MIPEIAGHRSIRQYRSTPVPDEVLREILLAGTRASTVGNMQLYSIIVTTDADLRAQLAPCHFNQPAAVTAPVLLTFCADVNRFSRWCELRGGEPAYDNFGWFVNAAADALLASQNVCLEAEAHGLGICYLGTTVYTAADIVRILSLPRHVIPVMTVSLGYPAGEVPLTDRLPLEAVVHDQRYQDYTPQQLEELWRDREASAETAALLRENNLPNLARIFTERRYTRQDNLAISRSYFETLRQQGFFNQ